MNKTTPLVLITMMVSVLAVFASAKPSDAPGILKKSPLEISNVYVSATSTSATISWSTSSPSRGSVIIFYEFDGVGYIDEKSGTHHEVTVPVGGGRTYEFLIESHSDNYGIASPAEGEFTTPVS